VLLQGQQRNEVELVDVLYEEEEGEEEREREKEGTVPCCFKASSATK